MMYVMHIASFYGLSLVAAGFVAFYFARRQQSSHLKAAAWILVIGGALGLSCILYYSLKYWQQGYFERPAAMALHRMMMHERMGNGMQQKRESPEHQHDRN